MQSSPYYLVMPCALSGSCLSCCPCPVKPIHRADMHFGRVQTAQTPAKRKDQPVHPTLLDIIKGPCHIIQSKLPHANYSTSSSHLILRLPAHPQRVDGDDRGRCCRECCTLCHRITICICLPLLPHANNGRCRTSIRRRRCRRRRRSFGADHCPPPALDTAQHSNLFSEFLSTPSYSGAVREAEVEQYFMSPVVVLARQTDGPARRCWPDEVPARLGCHLRRRAA
jgi:hypothetical protein